MILPETAARRALASVMATGVMLLLPACERKPSSSVNIVPADLRTSTQKATRGDIDRAIPKPDGVRILQVQTQSQPGPSPSNTQPARPESKPALPRAPTAAGKPVSDRSVSDAELTARVKSAVLAQPLSALMFNVSVSNGIVTLSGTADTADTRDKAARAAADVAGVRSVNNRISILTGS